MLEVDGDKREAIWNRNVTGLEEFLLPLLRRGVINLKDAKVGVGIAVCEGVEACSEENVLRHALGNCSGESVFSIAAAGD
jgi:hypothetical protein